MQLLQSTGNWINQLMSWAATTVSLIHDKLPGQQFSQHLLADIANHNPINLLLGQQIDHFLFAGTICREGRIVDPVNLNAAFIQKDQAICLGKMVGDPIIIHWNGSDHVL